MISRCPWATNDPIYTRYHDQEWGVPLYEEQKLFEFLILEGVQAGLSWLTVLKKRTHYRKVLDSFNPERIATYDEVKVAGLLNDPGLIRNRAKMAALVTNARAFLELKLKEDSFGEYLWGFVDGRPIRNKWRTMDEVPAQTQISRVLSKDLKQRGFKFVGPTICYALMQAVGMVNDHLVDCFRYRQV